MDFTPNLAIGITNAHWVKVTIAHIHWMCVRKLVDEDTFDKSKKALNELSSSIPEPSFAKFKERAITVLPEPAVKGLIEIPEKIAIHCAEVLLIKDVNETTFRKYYSYRNNLRDLAIKNKEVFQILNNKVTTVGYEFALFYNNLRTILIKLIHSRRYIEFINSSVALDSFVQGYSADKLDFIARDLELFNVSTFASSNINWFLSSMQDVGGLSKGVIEYIRAMASKKQVQVDDALVQQALSSADAILSAKPTDFDISFDNYMAWFIQMNSAITDMNKVIINMVINPKAVEEEASKVDKTKYKEIIPDLMNRIFDGERKREVFEEIFCEAPEVENMIYRLAQQLNNEYRNEKRPVCCVGFTEGCIIFLGKIIPLLNFPCHVVTTSLSFYGAATSGDASKEVELQFDPTKYDGKRVIIFDDILDRGITVKKFLEQAKVKTKAVDFKVCMLFAKPNPENVYGDADFLGYMLPNVWVVGYGFDTLFRHRNADAVGSIKESFKDEKNYPS